MPRAGGSTRARRTVVRRGTARLPGCARAPLVSRRRSPALWRPAPRRVGERPRKDGERECAEVHEVHEVHERDGNPNVGLHRDADPSAARLAYRAVAGLEVLRLVPEGVTAASGRQLRLPGSGGGDGPPLCSFSTRLLKKSIAADAIRSARNRHLHTGRLSASAMSSKENCCRETDLRTRRQTFSAVSDENGSMRQTSLYQTLMPTGSASN
jgi:hypothetical protein